MLHLLGSHHSSSILVNCLLDKSKGGRQAVFREALGSASNQLSLKKKQCSYTHGIETTLVSYSGDGSCVPVHNYIVCPFLQPHCTFLLPRSLHSRTCQCAASRLPCRFGWLAAATPPLDKQKTSSDVNAPPRRRLQACIL